MSKAPSPVPVTYVCAHCGNDHAVAREIRPLKHAGGGHVRFKTTICMGAALELHFNGEYQRKEVAA